jgi:branched-chain amino acid transport system permease protein
MFLQQLITGIAIGGMYSLISVGYGLIYGVFRFSNFAYGAVIMIGAYVGFFSIVLLHLPLYGAIFLTVAVIGIMSVVIEKMAYRPLRKRNSPRPYLMITAMGISIFLENIIILTIGAFFKNYPSVINNQSIKILPGVNIQRLDLYSLILSLSILLALYLYMQKTKPGIAIRAASSDITTTSLMGANVDRLASSVFFISGILAGVTGMYMGIKYTVFPQLGTIANKAFIANVIGGLGSMPGAVIGAMLLGIIETLVASYISSQLRDIISFTLLIVVLIFKPMGLMGKSMEEKA